MSAGDRVYWEKQEGGRLCAVHALNALVQGPVFTEVQLASAAHALDRQEKQLLGIGPNEHWESQNVDPDGNFSLPTMEEALKQFGTGVSMVNMDRPDVRSEVMKDCDKEQAYICNSHQRAHWYCIRKVNGKWYDFDSLKPAPQYISDFALAAMLESTMQQGFTIFVCRPKGEGGRQDLSGKFVMDTLNLPDPNSSCFQGGRQRQFQGHQFLLGEADIAKMKKDHEAREKQQMSDAQDKFGGGGGGGDGGSFGQVFNPREKKEVEVDWSRVGAGMTCGGAAASSAPAEEMDADMLAAIQASLSDVSLPEPQPEPAENGLELLIRFKTDEAQKRLFARTATMKQVFEFCEFVNLKENKFPSCGNTLYSHTQTGGCYSLLRPGFPKKEKFERRTGSVVLNDVEVGDKDLASLGFGKKEALTLQES